MLFCFHLPPPARADGESLTDGEDVRYAIIDSFSSMSDSDSSSDNEYKLDGTPIRATLAAQRAAAKGSSGSSSSSSGIVSSDESEGSYAVPAYAPLRGALHYTGGNRSSWRYSAHDAAARDNFAALSPSSSEESFVESETSSSEESTAAPALVPLAMGATYAPPGTGWDRRTHELARLPSPAAAAHAPAAPYVLAAEQPPAARRAAKANGGLLFAAATREVDRL